MNKKQLTLRGCRVQLDFPAQTSADVHTYLSTILTELAFAQAKKGGETFETSEMPVPGIDKEAG